MALPPVLPLGASHPTARTLRARWQAWREGVLASPRFQRWASGFVLTRPVARRRARQLFDIVAGFVYSQVLLACVRLKLFERLAGRPQTVDSLARQLSIGEAELRRLLDAAVSLELLERRDGETYGLGPLGAAMSAQPAIAAMVEHHAALYEDLADPVALLRERGSGALQRYWPYAGAAAPAALEGGHVAAYSALMAASQPLVADQILDAYSLARHRCLLDVGGGEGAFVRAAAARAPRLRLMVFDLPAVAARAHECLAREGLLDRAEALGGDFLREPLPQGADVISLVRVAHDHDDPSVLRVLRAAFAALPPGGTLLLAEPMAATPGAGPMGDAYFGLYLLAMGSGRPRTRAELTALLASAGFSDVRALPTHLPLQTGLLVARRASRASDTLGVNRA